MVNIEDEQEIWFAGEKNFRRSFYFCLFMVNDEKNL